MKLLVIFFSPYQSTLHVSFFFSSSFLFSRGLEKYGSCIHVVLKFFILFMATKQRAVKVVFMLLFFFFPCVLYRRLEILVVRLAVRISYLHFSFKTRDKSWIMICEGCKIFFLRDQKDVDRKNKRWFYLDY